MSCDEMRIGVVATFPDQKQPGAARAGYRRVSQLAGLLSPLHKVHLFVVAKHPWTLVMPGCATIEVLASSSLPGQWLRMIVTFWRHRRSIDVWIVYNPSKAMLPVLLLRWLGLPVVIDYCDKQAAIDHWGGGLRSRIYIGFQLTVERILLRRVRAFLVISNRLKERVLEVNPAAVCLLYRGTFVPPDPDGSIELSGKHRHVLYLGTLYDFNGPAVLIRALARIAASAPALRLVLVSPGPEADRHRLQELAAEEGVADRVEFHLDLDDAQVFGLLKRVDVLAVPYLEHPRNRFNFPTKLIEYLWAGKPILASRVGEIPDVLVGRQAMLVAPGEVDEWARAMQELYADRDLSDDLGKNARRLYQEQFAPWVARETINKLLTGLVARDEFN
jgi:glycosyltransferase involved in cell wall biosynthesis